MEDILHLSGEECFVCTFLGSIHVNADFAGGWEPDQALDP